MKLIKVKKKKNTPTTDNKYIVELDDKEYSIMSSTNHELYCTPCKLAMDKIAQYENICQKHNINTSDELSTHLNRQIIDTELINTFKNTKLGTSSNISIHKLYDDIKTENGVIREFSKIGYGVYPSSDLTKLQLVKNEPGFMVVIQINKLTNSILK